MPKASRVASFIVMWAVEEWKHYYALRDDLAKVQTAMRMREGEESAPDAGRQAPIRPDVAASRRIPAWVLGGGLALALAAGVGIGRWLLVPAQPTPAPVRFKF